MKSILISTILGFSLLAQAQSKGALLAAEEEAMALANQKYIKSQSTLSPELFESTAKGDQITVVIGVGNERKPVLFFDCYQATVQETEHGQKISRSTYITHMQNKLGEDCL